MTDSSSKTDTRERIIDCAEDLFGRKGYDSVAVADIAKAAGVSAALVYYHFGDKESLFKALATRAEHFAVKLQRAALSAEGTGCDRLEGFIQCYVELVHAHSNLARVLLQLLTDAETSLGDHILRQNSETIALVAVVIAEGIESGEFRAIDSRMAAESLFGMLSVRIVMSALDASHSSKLSDDSETVSAFITELFMKGISSC